MEARIELDAIYTPSEDVVFRDIEGELIIVPLTWGVGGTEDEADAIFTLNEAGRAIWERLDGQRSLRAVVAQRLARRLCEHCAEPYAASDEERRALATLAGDLAEAVGLANAADLAEGTKRGRGCTYCNESGYRGRTAIFELLEVDDHLRELIARPVSTAELRAAAIEAGMTTMLRDGVEKAMRGITTVEEVLRVLAGQQKEAVGAAGD